MFQCGAHTRRAYARLCALLGREPAAVDKVGAVEPQRLAAGVARVVALVVAGLGEGRARRAEEDADDAALLDRAHDGEEEVVL